MLLSLGNVCSQLGLRHSWTQKPPGDAELFFNGSSAVPGFVFLHARRSLAGLALLVALPALRCWGCVGRRRGRVPHSVVWAVWGHRPRSSRGHPAPVGGLLACFSLSASYINEKVMQTAWRCLSEPLAPHVIRTGFICLT